MVLAMAHAEHAASPQALAACGLHAVDHSVILRAASTDGRQNVISKGPYRSMAGTARRRPLVSVDDVHDWRLPVSRKHLEEPEDPSLIGPRVDARHFEHPVVSGLSRRSYGMLRFFFRAASLPLAPQSLSPLDPGGLGAQLEAMQRLISLHIGSMRLEEREGRHGWEHHLLDDIPLQVMPSLVAGFLRRRLSEAVDQRIDMCVLMVGVVACPGIRHPRGGVGIHGRSA